MKTSHERPGTLGAALWDTAEGWGRKRSSREFTSKCVKPHGVPQHFGTGSQCCWSLCVRPCQADGIGQGHQGHLGWVQSPLQMALVVWHVFHPLVASVSPSWGTHRRQTVGTGDGLARKAVLCKHKGLQNHRKSQSQWTVPATLTAVS